jgi:DNA-binding SARP family transcriptional activator
MMWCFMVSSVTMVIDDRSVMKLEVDRHRPRHPRVTVIFFCVTGVTGPSPRPLATPKRARQLGFAASGGVSVAIELVTFGGLHVLDDEGELDWLVSQHSRAALFVYLAVERRVSREALTTVFWPESDAENARHALRQGLYQLRKAVRTDWIESRAHELVVTGDVRTDVHEFVDALARGDVESAVRLYRGPFLDGVHLVDLSQWENWVDSRRAQYARAFRKACRELLESRRAAGDLAGAIEAAELWATREPLDDEAQHRLIEALANAGERAEAIRQYETYVRLVESDGLRLPDETRALGERLRAEAASLPALRELTVPVPAPAQQSAQQVNPALPPEPKTTRLARRGLAGAIGLIVLFASVWGLRSTRTEPAPVSSPTAVAVLPFSVHGGQAVEYLREGMVNLLAAAFDGAGSMRPVDTRATFAAAAEAGEDVQNVQRGDRLAARLGAGMYVLGDVVEAGGQLQIEAAVYRRGTTEAQARAVVSGAADSVFMLVDRLAARLLAGLSDPAADRLLRTASVTTASLPAFKAYLQGDRLMRAGQFERAADAYLAAIAHDSTFAVAYYRLGLAREWAPLPGEERAANAAAHYGARLSPRDRDLLEAFRAWRAGRAVEAERAYHAILARYPDDVDAWFQLAEIQFHHGPLLGQSVGASEEAWRKVLSYEPRNLFAVTHLARIAVVSGRVSSVDSLLATFSSAELRTDRRLTEIVLLRAVARADTATSHALANAMRKWDGLSVWRVAVFLTAFSDQPTAMAAVVPDLINEGASPALRADLLWFASVLDLASGQLKAARKALAEAAETERTVPAEHRRQGFEAVTEWFAATLPLPYRDSTLMPIRRAASSRVLSSKAKPAFEVETELGGPIQLEPLRQYTLGVLSLRMRDKSSAAAAAAKLRQLATLADATGLTRDLDRGLRARLAWQEGDPEQALRLLQSLESSDSQGDIAVTPFVGRANERFLRGELLAALGRNAEALQWFASLGDGSVTEIPLRAPSHFRQAEIHERLGNRDQAARHYAQFLRLWSAADPEFQPLVDTARRRLASLSRPD